MNYNEEAIFIKTKRNKNKTKFKHNKSISKINLIIIIFIVIIFILLIIIFVLIHKIHKQNKAKKEILLQKNNENNSEITSKIINESKISNETIISKPKIIQITYGNSFFRRQLKLNNKSAIEVGEVDEHYEYGPKDIDHEFKKKNKGIFSRGRGNGLWLWKPYIINKTIVEKVRDGDYLIYTDAAMLFMNSTKLLINFLNEQNASMWMNRLTIKERKYSKRDAFILMDADTPYYYDTNQYMAGIQIYKKTKHTIKFIQEYLHYSQDQRIVTDDPNTLGKENYPGFKDNRHDQTVFSLLIKKYGEANSGSPKMSLKEIQNLKTLIMPNILCIFRKTRFKDYEDLKQKCKKFIREQEHQII